MIIIVFRHIVSIFRNSRKSIAHDSSHMGRFQHFHIVLCISGGYRILNRDSQIIAEPSNRKSLGYSLWYDFLITVIREKAVYFSCILRDHFFLKTNIFLFLFCRELYSGFGLNPMRLPLNVLYIEHNIRFTRSDFNFQGVEERQFPVSGEFTLI